jgi:hypothetical protein
MLGPEARRCGGNLTGMRRACQGIIPLGSRSCIKLFLQNEVDLGEESELIAGTQNLLIRC